MTKHLFSGVYPAVTTQMKRDESLDLDANARHLETLLDSGVHGVIMLGSLGENATLAPEEKRDVVRSALEAVRADVNAFVAGAPASDDFTLLVLRWLGPLRPPAAERAGAPEVRSNAP